MEVEFRRTGVASCDVEIRRDLFPDLVGMRSRFGRELPHDVFHFVAEAELGLRRGIFGQYAAGGSAMFDLGAILGARGRELSRVRRRAKNLNAKLAVDGREEMEWSERAVMLLQGAWRTRSPDARRRAGRAMNESRVERVRASCTQAQLESLTEAVIGRVCARLDDLDAHWSKLPVGGGITLVWPCPEGPLPNRPRKRAKARATR